MHQALQCGLNIFRCPTPVVHGWEENGCGAARMRSLEARRATLSVRDIEREPSVVTDTDRRRLEILLRDVNQLTMRIPKSRDDGCSETAQGVPDGGVCETERNDDPHPSSQAAGNERTTRRDECSNPEEMSRATTRKPFTVSPGSELGALWCADAYEIRSVCNSREPDVIGGDT
jgi:hypothetical protein